MNLNSLFRSFLMPLGFLTTLWSGSPPASGEPLPRSGSGSASGATATSTSVSPPHVLVFVGGEFGELYALVSNDGRLLRPPNLLAVSLFLPDGKGGFIAAAQSENGKWGYLNEEGAWVVEPELETARRHAEDGLARYQRGETWGFIDLEGREVGSPSYQDVLPFDLGLAPVETRRGWSYLGTDGEIAIQGPFSRAREFSAIGLAPAVPKRGQKWGYIDRSGKFLIDARFDAVRPFGPGGTAPAAIEKEMTFNGEKLGFSQTVWGLIDQRGNWVLEPKYLIIEDFDADGFAAYTDIPPGGLGESGYLDPEGNVVLSGRRLSKVRRCGLVRDEYASGQFLKQDGKPLSKRSLTWASDFREDCISIALQEKAWGMLYSDGSYLKLPQYVEPLTDVYGSLIDSNRPGGLVAWLTAEGGIAYLDSGGNEKFRLTWKESGGVSKATLVSSEGKVLLSDAETHNLGRAQITLTPSARHHFVDPSYAGEGLMKVVDRLRQAKARLFYPISSAFESREDVYDIEEVREEFLEEELNEILNYGAIETLASTYIDEGLWGEYEYLSSSYSEIYTSYIESLTKRLSKTFGKPLKNPPVGDLRLSEGHERSRVWEVDGRYLVLDLQNDFGDGDFSYDLNLALVEEEVPSS